MALLLTACTVFRRQTSGDGLSTTHPLGLSVSVGSRRDGHTDADGDAASRPAGRGVGPGGAGIADGVSRAWHPDRSVTGADLAWFGHLQQLTYRRLAARPEWRDAVLGAVPADIRAAATANADATADLRATSYLVRISPPRGASSTRRRSMISRATTEKRRPSSRPVVVPRLDPFGRDPDGPNPRDVYRWCAGADAVHSFHVGCVRRRRHQLGPRFDPRGGALSPRQGAPGNMANALFRYNQSQRYVRAVTAYAEVMRAEPDAYRGYYNWQVYYLTSRGDMLLPVGYGR